MFSYFAGSKGKNYFIFRSVVGCLAPPEFHFDIGFGGRMYLGLGSAGQSGSLDSSVDSRVYRYVCTGLESTLESRI